MSKSKEIYLDLEVIGRGWVTWWLCSATSDQYRLLLEIKAIDRAAFYQNYAKNIARKVLFLLFKLIKPPSLWTMHYHLIHSLYIVTNLGLTSEKRIYW
jgi:hypothetical protein